MVIVTYGQHSMVFNMTYHFFCRCIEREIEVEELKQQLNKRTTEGDCCSKNEDLQLKDLQCRLDEEKRRAATFELQVCLH